MSCCLLVCLFFPYRCGAYTRSSPKQTSQTFCAKTYYFIHFEFCDYRDTHTGANQCFFFLIYSKGMVLKIRPDYLLHLPLTMCLTTSMATTTVV